MEQLLLSMVANICHDTIEISAMTAEKILSLLPYRDPFLFVDELSKITEEEAQGFYQFREDEFFYQGHFKDHPVTPGVILTETMAQIGVVSMGIYLLREHIHAIQDVQIALTSHQVDFYIPIFPGAKVKVISEKEYFRFNKLKCKVSLFDSDMKLACRGVISGVFKILKSE
jgi:3-hydroxyacyl-[acyl-carrier-protein] dehydratase